jgi:hypothetical protein
MRDIKRIDKVMDAITELWKILPDFRFWQIINIITEDENFKGIRDPFFMEDDKWLYAIERAIHRFSKKD